MRVVLVNMPWAPIDTPSLALGILRNAVLRTIPDAQVDVVHGHLDFVDWITQRHEFGEFEYNYYALRTYFVGAGDWVFSSALYDDPHWHNAEFVKQMDGRVSDEEIALSLDTHQLVPEFVAEMARRIVAMEPDVVGFTTMYQQNAAALATARHVKRLAPDVVTVFGGANCDGVQGEALHRNFGFVDMVVRGEGDATFPQLLGALREGSELAAVAGLCWRTDAGRTVANPMSTHPLPPGQIVGPDYEGYFERLEESVARTWVEPKLIVEGARGCWWGEKHHCTFCGLNGSFMQFRSKSPDRFRTEILDLVERHQVLDMIVVDNILDMGYLNSLLPALAESGYDLRLQYEIKSNMRRPQLRGLADAGLVYVQPGIESLSSRVLKIMDKGVTGCQNVRLLRDAATVGIGLTWNLLYGFPDEPDEEYEALLDQMPALAHLQPCDGAARIAIERFSPYFNRPDLGFADLAPAPQYSVIYDLPEAELFDLAYIFQASERGIGAELADRLDAAVDRWRESRLDNELTHCDLGTRIVLVNRRPHYDWTVLELTDPVEMAVFRLLDQPHSVDALARKLRAEQAAAEPAGPAGPADIAGLLARWRALGLVFHDDGHYVHVVPGAVNQGLSRVDPRLIGLIPTMPTDEPSGAEPPGHEPSDPDRRTAEPATSAPSTAEYVAVGRPAAVPTT